MTITRVNANAITALKDALTAAFWFKRDLYEYAKAAVDGDRRFLDGIDWTGKDQLKRDSVLLFVERLVREQERHQDVLLGLLLDVAAMNDFPQLQRAENPEIKIAAAREAIERLRRFIEPYEREMLTRETAHARIDAARHAAEERLATSTRLADLKTSISETLAMDPVNRGFAFERLLNDLFETFDLDPRGSFRVKGEQIDGGFTLDEHFLLEAKWQTRPVTRDDLDVFSAKVKRRSENTLGLFISINGYQPMAVQVHSGNQSPIILMDGGDLYAVLEERIDLRDLLRRKRREASMTGRILLTAADILGGN